jgi:RNA polymerase sigma factor, sigma-70 family|nr:RNA polymerase sigma factor [uncultured Stomatobaculum sp.]
MKDKMEKASRERKQRVTELIAAYQKGDKRAFDGIYSLCYGPIYYIIYKMIRDRHEAEDVTQEVFLQIFHQLRELTDPESFQCWSNRIAYHKTLDYMVSTRYAGVKNTVSLDALLESDFNTEKFSDQGRQIEQAEQNKVIMDAADHLSWALRATLLLRFFAGLREAEIADIMNVPLGTVKSRLAEAKKKMKKRLGTKLYCFSPFTLYTFLSQLESWNLSGKVATASVGFMGKTAMVLLSVGMVGSVALRGIRISSLQYRDTNRYVNEQLVRFRVDSGAPIEKVTLSGKQEVPLTRQGKVYEAHIDANGTYTITAKDIANHTIEQVVEISNIDREAPNYAGYREQDDMIYLYFKDTGASIDWDALCCQREDGSAETVRIDREQSCIAVSKTQFPLQVQVRDLAGNRAVYAFRQNQFTEDVTDVTEELTGESY